MDIGNYFENWASRKRTSVPTTRSRSSTPLSDTELNNVARCGAWTQGKILPMFTRGRCCLCLPGSGGPYRWQTAAHF